MFGIDSSLDRQSRADVSGKLTVPKTPNLETRKRSRPTSAVSQAEREEMELAEAKRLITFLQLFNKLTFSPAGSVYVSVYQQLPHHFVYK